MNPDPKDEAAAAKRDELVGEIRELLEEADLEHEIRELLEKSDEDLERREDEACRRERAARRRVREDS